MRNVLIPMFAGYQPLDITGPHEVFIGANEAMDVLGIDADRYDVQLVASTLEPVLSESGMRVAPTETFRATPNGPVHILLVPGGRTTRNLGEHSEMLEWMVRCATDAERVASVCTGTFLLAEAGLITEQRVTTHWAWAGLLATRFPSLRVDPDPIFLVDGKVWTSAGVTAGIDLALAMVEADCGASVAQIVARHLVVYLRRPGGQSQFGAPVWSEATEVQPIRDACDLIHRSPESDLTVATLAASVGMSERHFTRIFRTEVGESPARYVDRIRVEAARSILERETTGLAAVASRTGFSSPETLRRAFHRRLGISPADYRRTTTLTATTSTTNTPNNKPKQEQGTP